MKYNVLGFYQPKAVELGLCSDDLLVLRWFVDFAGTPKMKTMIIDNQIFYWVDYSTVLEELPILRISKQTLYKKHFTNLCNANVLVHKQIKQGGNFSYYCYGINYNALVYLQTEPDPSVKNTDLLSKSTKGSVEMEQTLLSKSTEQRLDNNIINLQDNNIKENLKRKKFEKPTLEEVSAYCKERNNGIDPEAFIAFYDSKGWLIGKNPMKNWKSAIITWEKKRQEKMQQYSQTQKKYGDGSCYGD